MAIERKQPRLRFWWSSPLSSKAGTDIAIGNSSITNQLYQDLFSTEHGQYAPKSSQQSQESRQPTSRITRTWCRFRTSSWSQRSSHESPSLPQIAINSIDWVCTKKRTSNSHDLLRTIPKKCYQHRHQQYIDWSTDSTLRSLPMAAPRPTIMLVTEISWTERIAEWAMLRTPPCSFLSSCP